MGHIDKDGRPRVWWRGKHVAESRKIWTEAKGEIPIGMFVHHIDHNPANNELKNLMLMTKLEHDQHHMMKDVDWTALYQEYLSRDISMYNLSCEKGWGHSAIKRNFKRLGFQRKPRRGK